MTIRCEYCGALCEQPVRVLFGGEPHAFDSIRCAVRARGRFRLSGDRPREITGRAAVGLLPSASSPETLQIPGLE